MGTDVVKRPANFWATLGFLAAISAIEGADLQLLPSSFRALERTLGLSPSHLASLGLAQALTQCTSGPLWGSLADNGWSRKMLLVLGAFSWGLLTWLLAVVTDFYSMIGLRALNGVALAALLPISQSMIADITQPHERGLFFGYLTCAGNVGVISSAILTTSISNRTIWGFDGWRVAFALVAFASFVLAIGTLWFMKEPVAHYRAQPLSWSVVSKKFLKYMSIPSFLVIVTQGAFGSIPWSALSFMIMFYQYIGVSDFESSLLFGFSIISGGFGAILGGYVGDRLTRWSRNHGRPLTAQISVASGIPLIFVVLSIVPARASSFGLYLGFMVVLSLLATWCSSGVNRPIITEIVGKRDRASMVAWLVALDGSIAAFLGAPVVGLLAERFFEYHPSTQQVADMPTSQKTENARALSKAMLFCTVGPWILCLLSYSFLHFTYGRDIVRAVNDDSTDDADEEEQLVKATEKTALM